MKVLNEIGDIEPLPPEAIFNRINHIYQLKPSDTNCSIASLTTLDRENWAKLRKHLSLNLENKIQLEEIDSALFCVSIENSNSINDNPISELKYLFAGDGINRWFDKSFTIAIDVDGTVGLSCEHSWGDGRSGLRLCEEVYNDSITSPFITPNIITTGITKSDSNAFIREIKFYVDATTESGIKQTIENHTLKMHSLKLNNFRFIYQVE